MGLIPELEGDRSDFEQAKQDFYALVDGLDDDEYNDGRGPGGMMQVHFMRVRDRSAGVGERCGQPGGMNCAL